MVATSAGPCDSPAVSQRSMARILPRPAQPPVSTVTIWSVNPIAHPGPEAHRRPVGDVGLPARPAEHEQQRRAEAAEEEAGGHPEHERPAPEPAEHRPDERGEAHVAAPDPAAGQQREQEVEARP